MRQFARARVATGCGLLVIGLAVAGCKSTGAAAPVVPATSAPSADRKAGWVVRLEQQRALRDAGAPAVAIDRTAPRALSFKPAAAADLVALSLDPDPSIRRRAIQAIGRTNIPAGRDAVVAALEDPEDEVRAMAAFALGLLGQRDSIAPLVQALGDQAPVVRHRAIEALGLIGERCLADARSCGSPTDDAARAAMAADVAGAAGAIARSVLGCAPVVATIAADDVEPSKPAEAEGCRLAWYAMVRLKSYDGLAQIAFDGQGRPVTTWWPLAYALQRINDVRTVPQLLSLASTNGVYTVGFALRGLAAHREARALPIATALATRRDTDIKVRIAAVRVLGQFGAQGSSPLRTLLEEPNAPINLRLEVINALGATASRDNFPLFVDLFTDPAPSIRAATLAAAAKTDPEAFLIVLAGLGQDREWSVRAALAAVLANFPAETVTSALEDLAGDEDVRVRAPALEALSAVNAPGLQAQLYAALEHPDYVVRGTAARLVGQMKAADGKARLVAAFARAASDSAYGARTGALEGLSKYGDEEARATIRRGLTDPAWPVRLKAAELLTALGDEVEPQRPGPLRYPDEFFESAALLRPSFSPHAFIHTRAGTLEIELDVVNAPITSATFIELARKGFYSGTVVHRVVPTFVVQDGDPRGDGEGGPGFTIVDELNSTPYVRGSVGMALEFRDTGGSQWFVTLSPQPHLDAKYALFGRVVNGWDVLDAIAQGDVIERVQIWDGVEFR